MELLLAYTQGEVLERFGIVLRRGDKIRYVTLDHVASIERVLYMRDRGIATNTLSGGRNYYVQFENIISIEILNEVN